MTQRESKTVSTSIAILVLFILMMFAGCRVQNSFSFHAKRGSGAYCPHR